MTQDLEKTLRLIKHLFAHAESAAQIGSSEEAATFAAKANELLLKHKLEMTDIELVTQDQDDPIERDYFDVAQAANLKKGGGRRRAAWIESLASALCNAHFCKLLVIPGTKRIVIIGRNSDRQIVQYLLTTLVREGERLAILYERQARTEAKRTGLPIPEQPKRGFQLGFTKGVRERLTEMRASVVKQGGQFALIRFDQAQQAVTKWFDQKYGRTRSAGHAPGSSTSNLSAVEAGRKAGRSQNLHGGLSGGSASSNGTLASGSRLIGGGK